MRSIWSDWPAARAAAKSANRLATLSAIAFATVVDAGRLRPRSVAPRSASDRNGDIAGSSRGRRNGMGRSASGGNAEAGALEGVRLGLPTGAVVQDRVLLGAAPVAVNVEPVPTLVTVLDLHPEVLSAHVQSGEGGEAGKRDIRHD